MQPDNSRSHNSSSDNWPEPLVPDSEGIIDVQPRRMPAEYPVEQGGSKSTKNNRKPMIIVGLILLVVIVAAGWVFMQQQSIKTPSAKQSGGSNTQSSEQNEVAKDVADDSTEPAIETTCLPVDKLCVDYPKESWNYEYEKRSVEYNGVGYSEYAKLTHKTSGLTMTIDTQISGIGGMCVAQGKKTTSILRIYTTKIPIEKTNDDTISTDVVYVISGVQLVEGKYQPFMYLSHNKAATEIGPVDPCDVYLAEYVTKIKDGKNMIYRFAIESMDEQGVKSDLLFDAKQEAIDILKTKPYQEAFEILKSARYEQGA